MALVLLPVLWLTADGSTTLSSVSAGASRFATLGVSFFSGYPAFRLWECCSWWPSQLCTILEGCYYDDVWLMPLIYQVIVMDRSSKAGSCVCSCPYSCSYHMSLPLMPLPAFHTLLPLPAFTPPDTSACPGMRDPGIADTLIFRPGQVTPHLNMETK